MLKTIQIHYTLLTRCVKRIEVDETFNPTSKIPEKIYEELCEKFPEEKLADIEDDEVYDFRSQDFGKIDGIEIVKDDGKIIKQYFSKKKVSLS